MLAAARAPLGALWQLVWPTVSGRKLAAILAALLRDQSRVRVVVGGGGGGGGGGAHANSELPQAGFPESGEVPNLLKP